MTHQGVSGLLALLGDPIFEPVVFLGDQMVALENWQVNLREGWIPEFSAQTGNLAVKWIILTPPGEQGLMLHLSVTGNADARAALRFHPNAVHLQRFRNDPLDVSLTEAFDSWTGAYVLEARAGVPLLALGLRGESPLTRQDDLLISQSADCTVYVGVAADADGARTTSVHLARLGFQAELERSATELARLAGPFPPLVKRHALHNYFFSAGDEIDGLGQALMTSCSPRYYVAGAFWARDALLWSFPAVLYVDADTAESRLLTALERYTWTPGEHAQYLNGRPLYPGFELDEAAAFPWAVARFVQHTQRFDFLQDPQVHRALERVHRRIGRAAHPSGLYATMLGPTDDPVLHPLLTYDNALLASAWRGLARLEYQKEQLNTQAAALEAAVWKHCVGNGLHGQQFVWATDGAGQYQLHDEPAGSLTLLPHLGFCSAEHDVYRQTERWIRNENPYHYAGTFPGQGSPHFPYPSCFSLANILLSGQGEVARGVLLRAPLDAGLACEGYDAASGEVRTGAGFAACSGFLAWAALDEQTR